MIPIVVVFFCFGIDILSRFLDNGFRPTTYNSFVSSIFRPLGDMFCFLQMSTYSFWAFIFSEC